MDKEHHRASLKSQREKAAHWHINWCRRKLEPADLSRTGKPV
jgi:hypothetical protein